MIYSAHDFPSDFSELNNYHEEEEPNNAKDKKKFVALKEQLILLNKRVKKHEKKEIDYKTEITELKNNLKNSQLEITDLKWKTKELESKVALTTETIVKKSFTSATKDPSFNAKFHYSRNSGNEIDIWKHSDSCTPDIKELHEITGSRELWINNLEHQIRVPNIRHGKLFPINLNEKSSKNYFGRESSPTKKIIVDPQKALMRKINY